MAQRSSGLALEPVESNKAFIKLHIMKTQITYYYLVKNNQIVFRGFNLSLMKKELETKIELSLYSHTLKLPVCTNLSESDLNKMVKIK